MKLEEQVLSIEQMQHIQELGVEVKDTAMCWLEYSSCLTATKVVTEYRVEVNNESLYGYSLLVTKYVPTLTLQEIMGLLPEEITYEDIDCELEMNKNCIMYTDSISTCIHGECDDSIINLAYKMLCWCAENGYLNKK